MLGKINDFSQLHKLTIAAQLNLKKRVGFNQIPTGSIHFLKLNRSIQEFSLSLIIFR